jgi:hypothetical protein
LNRCAKWLCFASRFEFYIVVSHVESVLFSA